MAQVAQARQRADTDRAALGLALHALGQAQARHAHADEALATLREAEATLRPLAASQADAWLELQQEIASALQELRQLGAARALMTALLPALVARYGGGDWKVLSAKAKLALGHLLDGQSDAGSALYAEIEPALATIAPEHAHDAAVLLADMAYGWQLVGRWDDAKRALLRSRDEFDRLEGPHNSDVIRVQRTLGALLADQGDYRGDVEVCTANLKRSTAFYGTDDPETAIDHSFCVLPLLMTGQLAAADAAARESLRIVGLKQRGLTPAEIRGMRRKRALAMLFAGRATEARAELETLAAADAAEGLNDGRRAATLLYLSAALRLSGRAQEAMAPAEQAAAIWRARTTLSSQMLAGRALLAQALAEAAAQRAEAAAAHLQQAVSLLQARLPAGHVLLISVDLVRAAMLREQGHDAPAADLDRRTRAELRARAGVELPPGLPLLP